MKLEASEEKKHLPQNERYFLLLIFALLLVITDSEAATLTSVSPPAAPAALSHCPGLKCGLECELVDLSCE